MITVFFTAYSPDGLIYFRGSQDNGDFISLELRNGSVVFKFYLGGESSVVVQSKKKSYNDGRTHTIRAIRTKQEGALQVDSEADRVTLTAPGANSALNVGDGNHFVGGVPASFNISKWERFDIQWRGFFGCISSVKPSQFNELDLDNPVRSQRKQPGCLMDGDRLHTTDRVIGFPHPGYFVVSGISMNTNSSLAFDFRTREANATLLFQSSRLATYHRREREASEGQGYLAFYLYQGYLVAHLGTDPAQRSKLVTLRTDAKLNDGHLHAVFLSRDGETVRLIVNDRLVANGTLSETAEIGSPRAQMFIGGFPDKVKPTSTEIPSSVPMIGCISDIYLNFKRVPLIPEVHNATIGMCKLEDPRPHAEEPLQADSGGESRRTADRLSVQLAAPTVELRGSMQVVNGPFSVQAMGSNLVLVPTRPPPEMNTDAPTDAPTDEEPTTTIEEATTQPTVPSPTCIAPPHRTSDKPGAARFGLSKRSHFRVTFPRKEDISYETFSLSFSFRTSKPNGMLWVWANYKNYTRYFNMSLAEGRLELTIKGSNNTMVMRIQEGLLDDNEWHTVKINKADKELRLQVDDLSTTEKKVPKAGVVRKRMFVGGIAPEHERLLLGRNPEWKFPNFDGCISDFVLDGITYDLLTPKNFARDVVPCVQPTPASYVHEGGYFTFNRIQYQGDVIQLGVEFRSGKANGWILALLQSNYTATRVGLRLISGKILFEVVIDGVKKYVHDYDSTDAPTCDGQWHHISVTLDGKKDEFITIFDGARVPIRLDGTLSRDDFAKLKTLPLHVGGLAENAISNLGEDSQKGDSSLQGCFGRLQAGGADLAFESARRSNKVLLRECYYEDKTN
uniref:Laminin G domain-containing protein n=1 Tax=Plectus sambesii TaxID=2011161 RepID=A0A914VG69_9BILA